MTANSRKNARNTATPGGVTVEPPRSTEVYYEICQARKRASWNPERVKDDQNRAQATRDTTDPERDRTTSISVIGGEPPEMLENAHAAGFRSLPRHIYESNSAVKCLGC